MHTPEALRETPLAGQNLEYEMEGRDHESLSLTPVIH